MTGAEARPGRDTRLPASSAHPGASGEGATAVLEARGVTMRFGGVAALSDVDLTVPAAGVLGVVGPNGAGKTTLFGVLSGLLRPVRGQVLLRGEDVTDLPPRARADKGLARTYQRVQLFPELTVREHLVLAWRARHRPPRYVRDVLVPRRGFGGEEEDRRVEEVTHALGLSEVADRPAHALPLGTARLVEVARALVADPSVVLLDEPSSGLNPADSDQLAATLARVRAERGVALVVVEHDLDFVLGLSDRVDVLDFGVKIASGTPEEIRKDPRVRAAYLGTVDEPETNGRRRPGTRPPGGTPAAPRRPSAPEHGGEPSSPSKPPAVVEVRDLSVSYGGARVLSGVSWCADAGTVTAVLGPNGAGKSTLCAALSRAVPVAGGRIVLDGRDVTRCGAHHVARLGVAHIPEAKGVFPALSVAENLKLAVDRLESREQRRAAIEYAYELFPILRQRRDLEAGRLSGGERQMLAVARVLAVRPRLLIADEICLGLAPKLVELMFDSLEAARDAGTTIVVAEQYVERALELADHVLILVRGEVAWSGPASEAAEEVVRRYLAGADVSERA